jgi:predicted molibdopterin-dependent oxidoreductase YjgC
LRVPARGYRRPLPRLTQPLVRRGGTLTPVSWDEALDEVAGRMAAIRRTHGPDAFCCFSCSKASNELNFVAQKFMRTAIGTNNIDSCNRT